MQVNGKMIQVETLPGLGEGDNKGECWKGEFKCDIFDILQEFL
jgi:hypothetical protein